MIRFCYLLISVIILLTFAASSSPARLFNDVAIEKPFDSSQTIKWLSSTPPTAGAGGTTRKTGSGFVSCTFYILLCD